MNNDYWDCVKLDKYNIWVVWNNKLLERLLKWVFTISLDLKFWINSKNHNAEKPVSWYKGKLVSVFLDILKTLKLLANSICSLFHKNLNNEISLISEIKFL